MVSPDRDAPKALVLFDGQCPFCLRWVASLKRIDWLHRLRFENARDPANIPATEPPLAPARLLEEMHLVTPRGRVYHGFGAFRWIAWRIPILVLLAPLLYLPGMARLGQRIYLWVARNRFDLVPCHGGVCTLHRKQERV